MRGCAGCTRWPYTLLGGPEASPPLTLAPRTAAEPDGGELWLWMAMMGCVFSQSCDIEAFLLPGPRCQGSGSYRPPVELPKHPNLLHGRTLLSLLPWLQQLILPLTDFSSCSLFSS